MKLIKKIFFMKEVIDQEQLIVGYLKVIFILKKPFQKTIKIII
jgi:hypothetical protein